MKIQVDKLVLGAVNTNCYVVSFEGKCLIIDPSAEAERIISLIEEKGVKPLAILLTHGHFDHVLAADELRKRYEIEIYASIKEDALLRDADINLAKPFLGLDFTLQADRFLKDGEVLTFDGFSLKVIETPGHTKGSLSFYSEDLEGTEGFDKVLFSGDAVFCGSIGRVDFPTGSEKYMRKTIHEILKKLPDETMVFSGHGMATTIGKEKASNPYF